jgi:hypothetical protein
MVVPVSIDISKLPRNLKSVFIREMTIGSKQNRETNSGNISTHEPYYITLTDGESTHKVKRKLKDILIKNKVTEYVITQDENEKDKLIVLERSSAEKSGKYHCIHCGMEFENEVHLSVHHRLHYLV